MENVMGENKFIQKLPFYIFATWALLSTVFVGNVFASSGGEALTDLISKHILLKIIQIYLPAILIISGLAYFFYKKIKQDKTHGENKNDE